MKCNHGNYKIPQSTYEGLVRYRDLHVPTGDFLRAVLENKLKESFTYADDFNTLAMQEIVKFCYWELPSNCWGSEQKVNDWLALRELYFNNPPDSSELVEPKDDLGDLI